MTSSSEPHRRLVVGVTGSSSPHLAFALLTALKELGGIETHLVMSKAARLCVSLEMDVPPEAFEDLADVVHRPGNMAAAISSGSFKTLGMVVIPCSMKTLGAVANGVGVDLIGRAADVCLKERRTLVLVTRETPLNLIHIRNMETATLAGATILPPVPAFYHHPRGVDDLLSHIVGRVLDQFDIDHDLFERWS